MRHGTWQETGGGGHGIPVARILIGAVVAGVAWGIAEAVAAITEDLVLGIFITVFVLAAATVAGGTWALVYRLRHGEPPWAALQRRFLPQPVLRELPAAERPAVGQAMPREVHQHTHYHWHGAEQPAEIIRRGQPPEQ